MTKTFGQHLVEDAIPPAYRPQGVYTKGALFKSMLNLAKDDPELYAKTIVKVKSVGDEVATMEGLSVGLDDIEPVYAQRNAVMQPAISAFNKAKTRDERQKVVGKAQQDLLSYAKTHPGTMGDMARSGGRGNMIQLMKAVGSPVAANDEKDRVQPWLIRHSYSEGLKPADWWAANREARMAAAKSTIEVSEPGDLSKIIANNTMGQTISVHDCHTHNGLRMATNTVDALDRYLAQPAGAYRAGTLITKRVLDDLAKSGTAYAMVRSPMTCEAQNGICQMCMGNTVTGKLNRIGDNVGIRAAHALGEPLTQLALNAKHGVRTAGGSAGVSGLSGFRALIETPATFKGKAALAPIDGSVTRIEKAPQGGHYIYVSGERVHTPEGFAPKVKIGQLVHAGDALSDGTPKPDEVVHHKGLGAGRQYLVNELSGIYQGSGIDVDRRHLEVLAKSMLNHLDVTKADPNAHGIIRGDVIDYNKFRAAAEKAKEDVPVDAAVGKFLADPVQEHLPGTRVTPGLAADLKRRGVTKVTISSLDVQVAPRMAAATRNPLLNPDWMVRAGHRYLKNTLVEGAARGDVSNIRGLHPIPAMVFNPEFGDGDTADY